MREFTTRVELHDAESNDYETLHEEMERNGFSRTVIGSSGSEYHLPWAEYDYNGDATKEQVLQAAKRAAKITGCKAAIIVTQSAGRAWSGLDKVGE